MEKYHETESYYADMLNNVREQIIGQVQCALERLGGRICPRHYHEFEDMERNAFFEMDDDGHGVELFIDSIEITETGEVEVTLQDSEDCYSYVWDLSDFNASNALYLLSELEDIIKLVEEEGRPIITDYDENYEDDED